MKLRTGLIAAAAFGFVAVTGANAGNVLIINGESVTSETSTTASITTQLQTLHEAVGNVVTLSDGIPANFASYNQVWDIRFSDASALGASDISNYVNYLARGGGMFVMGENSGFMIRNASVLALISAAGGGDLSLTTPTSYQTVVDPFTGPNAVSHVQYAAPGGVTSHGTGQWISTDGSSGTGVAWGKGGLANAANGALTVIFDVNFMQTDAIQNNQDLTKNLIGFVGDQVEPPPVPGVPEPASWMMLISGFGLIGLAMRRRRTATALA